MRRSITTTLTRLRPVHWASLILVGAYLGTTGIAAALFTTRFGQDHLIAFMAPELVPFGSMTTLGSPTYWLLLSSFVVLAPLIAIATEKTISPAKPEKTSIDVPTWIPIALAATLAAFCIYKLHQAGALSARELWDRSVCFPERMQRRSELMSLLGNRYYAFAYSSLPIIAVFLLAKRIKQGDRAAGTAFAVISALIVWFDLAMIMKAPLVIYMGLVALTLMFSGFGFTRSLLITAPGIVAIYLALSFLQFCNRDIASWNRAPNLKLLERSSTAFEPQQRAENTIAYKAMFMARAALFRMGSSFPYYVQEFSDHQERCGIETPPIPFLPRQRCFPPIKIFSTMYPNITYTKGYAPAPVNIAAYAEMGIGYCLLAISACGFLIGWISAFARGGSPFSIALAVTACLYAYYCSQTSMTGSLVDGYGLLWMIFPLAAMAATKRLSETLVVRQSNDARI